MFGKVMTQLKNIHYSERKCSCYVTVFPTSYPVESGFSCVSYYQKLITDSTFYKEVIFNYH